MEGIGDPDESNFSGNYRVSIQQVRDKERTVYNRNKKTFINIRTTEVKGWLRGVRVLAGGFLQAIRGASNVTKHKKREMKDQTKKGK